MKLISLNTYGGAYFEALIQFIKGHSDSTDFFCFQEVFNGPKDILRQGDKRANFFYEVQKILPLHSGVFDAVEDKFVFQNDVPENTEGYPFGDATFINQTIKIIDQGSFFLCNSKNSFVPRNYFTLGYNAQYSLVEVSGKQLLIINAHGTSEPGDKLDTEARLAQSQKILDFAGNYVCEKIITGDFNLFPNTKSIEMIETAGYKNLIKEYNISSTRGSLIKKIHPEYANTPLGFQEFADYTFVSPGIKATSFTVPDLPISDHLPLILEFKL